MFVIMHQLYGEVKNLATAEHLSDAKWFVDKEIGQQIKTDQWQKNDSDQWVVQITEAQSYIIEALKHIS